MQVFLDESGYLVIAMSKLATMTLPSITPSCGPSPVRQGQ